MITQPARGYAEDEQRTLDVAHLLITGAATAVVIFVVCWLGTLVPRANPSHVYIGLFTNFEAGTSLALIDGSVWSLLFGGLTAALFAVVYNAAGKLVRR